MTTALVQPFIQPIAYQFSRAALIDKARAFAKLHYAQDEDEDKHFERFGMLCSFIFEIAPE